MAALVLRLSRHEFDAIGALAKDERGFSIARRPVTFNMNELMVSANLPEETHLQDSHGLLYSACYTASHASSITATRCCQQRGGLSEEIHCS
jgi:hypothetical protein